MLRFFKLITTGIVLMILVIGGVSGCGNEGGNVGTSNSSNSKAADGNDNSVEFNEPEVTMPMSGTIEYFIPETVIDNAIESDEFGVLGVSVPKGTEHYYVLLKEIASHGEEKTLAFFIGPGETEEIAVPFGQYYVYYAAGETWYGEEHLFGPDTVYSKADDIFEFDEENEGWDVELIEQFGGNLDTLDAAPSDFN